MTIFKTTVGTHLENKDIESLKKFVDLLNQRDIIELIKELSTEERVIVFRLLTKEKALFVFEHLDTGFQQELLTSFTEEKAIEMISELAPDDRVRLFDELPAKITKRLIMLLSPEERKITAELMGYTPETAGRIMTPEYIQIRKDMTAAQALEKVRNSGNNTETVYILYVTDDNRKLEGVLSLRELVMACPTKKIEEIMHTSLVKVATGTDQEEVARLLKDIDLLALPVVDKEDRLVGIITVDDAIDILEEETTEDIFDKAGLADLNRQESDRSIRLVNGSIWDIWKVRLPFLIITLVGGMLAGVVIDAYEEALNTVAALAIFIPVIMDMGGNAGTQSSTIFARALILGHIRLEQFSKHLLKETLVGFSMGTLVGVIAAIVAAIWQPIPGLGIAVGLSLTFTMTLATALGFLIPYILFKLNIDQAAGADPIITTIKDITGLLIYFVSAHYFLGYMM